MNLRSIVGLVLSLAGAALDFSTGYLILQNQLMTTTDNMGMVVTQYNASSLFWGLGLLALGVLLIATGFLSLTAIRMKRMGLFGSLMAAYGMIMLLVGYLMYSGLTPIMQGSMISSLGMFLLGVLMIASGVLMSKNSKPMMTRTMSE